MNVVMTGAGGFVEVQGTAEGAAFSRAEMDASAGAGRQGHRASWWRRSRSRWRTLAAVSDRHAGRSVGP